MKIKELALDGIIRQNPALKLVLGTCSILALSNEAINGLGMGAAVTFVLVCSNLVISILRNIIPDKVRIPAFILIIATFVTVVKMLLYYLGSKSAAIMGIYDAMDIFLPLIVVNCIILARAESFASHNTVGMSVLDGLFMGIGYTVALTLLGAAREILGSGSIFGVSLWNFKIEFFTTPAGAFMTYGLFIALFTFVYDRIVRKRKLGGAKILKPKTTEV
ncbi:MAG TPA: electron transport complex subunit RsxE [Clostridia bacterium]|nr:electron transport complex subunit RsxE [Clostridia bacterium]